MMPNLMCIVYHHYHMVTDSRQRKQNHIRAMQSRSFVSCMDWHSFDFFFVQVKHVTHVFTFLFYLNLLEI